MRKNDNSIISSRLNWKWYKKYLTNLSPQARKARLSIIRKISKGIYELESVSCYCGNNNFDKIAGIDKHAIKCDTLICKRCGLLVTNPRLNQISLLKFYDNEYRLLYDNLNNDIDDYLKSELKASLDIYKYITGIINKKFNIVFEIGCNYGSLLSIFQDNRSSVVGVDYGSDHIEIGKKYYNIKNLFTGGVESLKILNQKADLVILNHVFEHFSNLDKELNEIKDLLTDKGYIYISVPGIIEWIDVKGGNVLNTIQIAHLYYFNLTLLSYIMYRNGFELIDGNERIFAIFQKNLKMNKETIKIPDEYFNIIHKLKDKEFEYQKDAWKKFLNPKVYSKFIPGFLKK